MSKENDVIDNADHQLDIKAVEKLIVEKFDTISESYETANTELKGLGEVSIETKGKIEKLAEEYDGLYERMQTLEQKGTSIDETDALDIGAEFTKTDGFKDFQEGRTGRARMEVKTAIINATGASQPLVAADRLGGIYTTPNRRLTIRDILPTSPTNSNLVEFTRENAFTNNAGPTVSGSPEAFENVTKPESANTFTLVSEAVVTLAHFIPASKQVLSDSDSLHSHINGRLMYGLKLKEDTQLLLGSGANGELNGLVTQATAYTVQSPQLTNELDIIREVQKQAQVAEYFPDFVVLNPQDWYDIDVRKVGTSDDRYVVGNPRDISPPNLWGMPVVVTNSITSGTFLVGSSMACEIKDREQAAVEMSFEDSTNFQKNMVTIRAEERLALCVYRTEAFITGSL